MTMSKTSGARLAAGAAALLSAGLAGGAFAHPHPDGDREKVRKVIILEDEEKKGARRIVRLDGARSHCAGEKTEVVEESGAEGEKQKTRIVVCARDGAAPGDRARHLAEALARVQSNDALSPEHREKLAAAIREAMEKTSEAN